MASDPKQGDRNRPRVLFSAQVRLEQAGQTIEDWLAHNLSERGIFIETETPLPVEAEVALTVVGGEGDTLFSATARVQWTRAPADGADDPPGMGLMFTELDDKDREMVERIVRLSPPESLDPTWPGQT